MGMVLQGLWRIGIAAVIAAAGCGQESRQVRAAGSQAATSSAVVATPAMTEDECRHFAELVIKAVKDADLAALKGLLDQEAILETMAAGLNLPERDRADYFAGIRKSLAAAGGFMGQIVEVSKKGGSFTFLRIRQNHGRQVILFRLIHPDSSNGVNYLELVPRRSKDGRIRAVDVYIYLVGEFASESLRRALLPMIAERSRSALSKLVFGEQDYVQDLPRIREGNRLMRQGKPAEALKIYKALRPGTRKQKNILLCQFRAAQEADDEKEYAAVIDEIRRTFPGDPCIDFISIDGLLMRKEFDEAMKAIDRVDRSLGGDPYLNIPRASVCESRGDLEDARRFIRRALAEEPTLLDAHWSLVGFALEAKDYKETLSALEEIHRRFAMEFGDMTKIPEYAGFVKSPQYKDWLDYLAKNRSPRKPEAPAKASGKVNEMTPPRPGGASPPGSAATRPR